MTSPRQRKKHAAFLSKQKVAETVETKLVVVPAVVEKPKQSVVADKPAQSAPTKTETVKEPETVVARPAPSVVASAPSTAKPKKLGSKQVEAEVKEQKSQDQVVEQIKTEVKTETKE